MSSQSPLVSLCIPCYKNPETLRKCLSSVLKQSYTNIEVIITDDSPDNQVFDVVNEFNDQRISYFRNPVALGSPENWNEGLRKATGAYIKVMHHDDWFDTEYALARFVEMAVTQNADFVCSYCYNVTPVEKKKHRIPGLFRRAWAKNRTSILYANYIGNPSTILFRNPGFPQVFYDKKSIWYVDVIFYYDYVRQFPSIAYIEEYLVATSAEMETQITNSAISPKIAVGEFMYISNKYDLFTKRPFLTKLSLLEILKRYDIKSKNEMEALIGSKSDVNLPYFLLKLPITHQLFNVIKHTLLLLGN